HTMSKRDWSSDVCSSDLLVGKYVELKDAYLSVAEALRHGGIENSVDVDIDWIQSDEVNEDNYKATLKDVDGILVPGGFGDRGMRSEERRVGKERSDRCQR